MKKYIMFLLLACVVGVGYGKVYNVGDTIYSVSYNQYEGKTLDQNDEWYVLTDFDLSNITSVKVSWKEFNNETKAKAAYSLDGGEAISISSSNGTIDTRDKKKLDLCFKRKTSTIEAILSSVTISVTDVNYNYTRESLTVGNIGTICLPNSVEAGQFSGATFYEVSGKSENEVYFSEVTALQAGMPYVFCATEQSMSINFTESFVKAPANHNGLYGVFENFAFSGLSAQELENVYIIKNNTVQKASAKSGVNANRAYLKLSEIPSISSAPEGRTLVLGYEPEESGSQTGVGDVIDEEDVPLIIHTLQGQRVKKVVKDDFYIVNRKEVKYLKAE